MRVFRSVRQRLFTISDDEVSFERRGFEGEQRAREHLEGIGRSFLRGYHASLEDDRPQAVAALLSQEPGWSCGFSFEGAAMSLAILDVITPWRRRLAAYLDGPGSAHIYMTHVGAGWSFGRLPFGWRLVLRQLDPLLVWLAYDGYGFHEGYFRWPESIAEQRVPPILQGYERRAFTQGLGRSLWFVKGCDIERVAVTIKSFDEDRKADLWSGIGLACTYASGVDRSAHERAVELAGPYLDDLAQGSAFAAKARQRAGNLGEATEIACEVICCCSAAEAAAITDDELEGLPAGDDDRDEPPFEVWRQRIRERCAARRSTPVRAAV